MTRGNDRREKGARAGRTIFGVWSPLMRVPSSKKRSAETGTPLRCAYALKIFSILVFGLTLKNVSSPDWRWATTRHGTGHADKHVRRMST